MNILADASLPGLDEAFPHGFNLTRYKKNEDVRTLLKDQDILFCRSTLKVNESLLSGHRLNIVATASSGSDHIDLDYLKTQNTTVIDAKGCNAHSVADYVQSCIAYLNQKHLIKGRKTGIIGLGHVGREVQNRLKGCAFELYLYDPLKASQDKGFISCSIKTLYSCDVLSIHAELHQRDLFPSHHLINEAFLNQLKPNCVIINAARGGIVDEAALLNTSTPLTYCTDVYINEPKVDKRIIDKSVLCTPHIAGHSIEGKANAIRIASQKIHELLGLKIPVYALPEKPPALNKSQDSSQEDFILAHYNPIIETQALKQAMDVESMFINLRQRHNKRHDRP